ncbi:MAG: response regulator [Candidatus Hydrogenedentes bacterium]|nr:response regulator [Candidatus Hydrogenedentota bacterium]
MKAVLEGHCRVIEAMDGREGVRLAAERRPDIIFMDIAMPVMDGLQAIKVIRADEALRDIPVLAVTASAMTGDREAILAHGFDGYLSKPIDPAALLDTVKRIL